MRLLNFGEATCSPLTSILPLVEHTGRTPMSLISLAARQATAMWDTLREMNHPFPPPEAITIGRDRDSNNGKNKPPRVSSEPCHSALLANGLMRLAPASRPIPSLTSILSCMSARTRRPRPPPWNLDTSTPLCSESTYCSASPCPPFRAYPFAPGRSILTALVSSND